MDDLFSGVEALTVEELALQIRRVVESDPILSDVAVTGEISNFKAHGSGHLYFTLKDEAAQIRACMWRTSAARLNFRPSNGDKIIATGRVEYYGPRGEMSFICDTLRFAGQGALFEALERIKTALAEEGLFDPARKRPLPPLPRRIGLITSPTGAVAHDVLSILRRRWPFARILFIPAKVQGFDAAPDLVRALSWAAAVDDLDLLIVGRGGGSAEDLWAFNDEELARAVAAFPHPVISAVGHETDFTIMDFVADLRAPTPSAAAELATPDIRALKNGIDILRARLVRAVEGDIQSARHQLESLRRRRVLSHPAERLVSLRDRVALARMRSRNAVAGRVKIERRLIAARRAQLDALDPRRVLERGYALIEHADGQLLKSSREGVQGEVVTLRMRDGQLAARIESSSVPRA